LWLAMAHARMGSGDQAVRLLQFMNPVEGSRDEAGVARFRGEPYVCPADVSAAPDRAGRCGWTWYTGSAAWMYRVWIEEVLGIKLRGSDTGAVLTIEPSMPRDWPGFELTYRYRSSTYKIRVERSESAEPSAVIQLTDDGATHEVLVRVSDRKPAPAPDSAKAGPHAESPPVRKPELIPQP
jgi:cyclic beta-1,2-glucan synthetase